MYPPDGLLTSGELKNDIAPNPNNIAPDPISTYDCLDVFSPFLPFLPTSMLKPNTMNTGEDEPSLGLNGRLRPRKHSAPSPQTTKLYKKSDGKSAQDKPKKSSTTSKASPNKLHDLLNKSEFLCPYCDKKFTSKQTLSKHTIRIHISISNVGSPFKCLYCNHIETDANEVIQHMVDSHPNQYFACLDCHNRFPSTSDLAEHKLNACEQQKQTYRTKLRQKRSVNIKKSQKSQSSNEKGIFEIDKEYQNGHGFNGIVISCELKPSQIHEGADIEDNITTNLILPPNKNLGINTGIEKNAIIVLDDIQWNKRIPPNFSFHNTDADQILSRLGVVHRAPRTEDHPKRDCIKTVDDPNQKFERCFDTNFYSKVASNVQENLTKFLDGSFNFNPDPENIIKTRKSKNSVNINTAEGFPILLAYEQFCRNYYDGYMPRALAPRHKWKWENLEIDKSAANPDQVKRDAHTNNCIITLVSSLDIWTQLRMRRKYEEIFSNLPIEKKTEQLNIIGKELKEILESREIPTSSSHLVKYKNKTNHSGDGLDFPSSLELMPAAPKYNLQPAVLSGEWVRPRCYVCCACGAQMRDSRGLSSHISTQHPNAQVQHYEIAGDLLLNTEILQHFYVPPTQVINRTRPLRGMRECTKCKKSVILEELHQHMLDCAGDMPAVRRKCRYRPFGVRKRRTRLPDNTIRKKIRKDIRTRHSRQKSHARPRPKIRSEVGDAETIRKMIADLPAKRHRVMINPMSAMLRPRTRIDKQRGKLLIKRRPSDDLKSKRLRSRKIVSKIITNESTSCSSQPKTVVKNDDSDDLPLKPRRVVCKNGPQKDSIKVKRSHRQTVLMNPQYKNDTPQVTEEPNYSAVDSSSTTTEQLSNEHTPQKINVQGEPYNTRQNADRSQRSNNRNNDHQQPGSSGQNGNINNSNSPTQNVPLKHSIARLTANSETHDKSVQFHHLFLVQQECNNIDQHLPTEQRRYFENEAVVTKLDKPPLHFPNESLDLQALHKSKLNKPRKGLNDCIAMLKNKLVVVPSASHISVQCGGDDPIYPHPKMTQASPLKINPDNDNTAPYFTTPKKIPSHSRTEIKHSVSNITQKNVERTEKQSKTSMEKLAGPFISKINQEEITPFTMAKEEFFLKRKSTRQQTAASRLINIESASTKNRTEITPQVDIILKKTPNIPPTPYRAKPPKHDTNTGNYQLIRKKRNVVDEVVVSKVPVTATTTSVKVDKPIQVKVLEIPPEKKSSKSSNQLSQSNQLAACTSVPVVSEKTIQNDPLKKKEVVSYCAPNPNLQNIIETPITETQKSSSEMYPDTLSIIPFAHSSNMVNSIVSTPLDLSGKVFDESVRSIPIDNIYLTDYSYCETLDLSNKNVENVPNIVNDPDVVDLSIKSLQLIDEINPVNLHKNVEQFDYDTVTDLSIKKHQYYIPTDLSLNANERNLILSHLDLEERPQDLSTNRSRDIYSDSICLDINKLREKSPVRHLSITNPNQAFGNVTETTDYFTITSVNKMSKIDTDFPADLSTKPNLKHTAGIQISESQTEEVIMPEERSFNIQEDCNKTQESDKQISDDFMHEMHQPAYDPTTRTSEYPIRVNISTITNSEETTNNLDQPQPLIHTHNQISGKHNPCSMNIPSLSQERIAHAVPDIGIINVTSTLHIDTIPNRLITTSSNRVENTTPVYTLPYTCISITKIGTSNSTTLTNTLLSIPGTTITNTTSVYTLAGSTVGTHINYGAIPNPIPVLPDNFLQTVPTSKNHIMTNYNNSYYGDGISKMNTENNKFESQKLNDNQDLEIEKKIALLPKELVDILGKMPLDHRKQLIDVLPHYVSTSLSTTSAQNESQYTNVFKLGSTDSTTTVCASLKKSGLSNTNLKTFTQFSSTPAKTFGDELLPTSQTSMLIESLNLDKIHLSSSLHTKYHCRESTSTINKDVRLDSINKSTKNGSTPSDDNSSLLYVSSKRQIENIHEDPENKIIDLTNEDTVLHVPDTETFNDVKDNIPKSIAINPSEAGSKCRKQKNNDQTASLRAVRIKTPSERKKSISTDIALQDNALVELQHVENQEFPNKAIEDTEEDKLMLLKNSLDIQRAEVSSTQHAKYRNLKKLSTDSSNSESGIKVDNVNNKTLLEPLSKATNDTTTGYNSNFVTSSVLLNNNMGKDLNNLISGASTMCTHVDVQNTINESSNNDKLTNDNSSNYTNSNKSLNTNSIILNTKKTIDNDDEQSKCVISNDKTVLGDDSEDDIFLAVIVKQKQINQQIDSNDYVENSAHAHLESQNMKQKKFKKSKKLCKNLSVETITHNNANEIGLKTINGALESRNSDKNIVKTSNESCTKKLENNIQTVTSKSTANVNKVGKGTASDSKFEFRVENEDLSSKRKGSEYLEGLTNEKNQLVDNFHLKTTISDGTNSINERNEYLNKPTELIKAKSKNNKKHESKLIEEKEFTLFTKIPNVGESQVSEESITDSVHIDSDPYSLAEFNDTQDSLKSCTSSLGTDQISNSKKYKKSLTNKRYKKNKTLKVKQHTSKINPRGNVLLESPLRRSRRVKSLFVVDHVNEIKDVSEVEKVCIKHNELLINRLSEESSHTNIDSTSYSKNISCDELQKTNYIGSSVSSNTETVEKCEKNKSIKRKKQFQFLRRKKKKTTEEQQSNINDSLNFIYADKEDSIIEIASSVENDDMDSSDATEKNIHKEISSDNSGRDINISKTQEKVTDNQLFSEHVLTNYTKKRKIYDFNEEDSTKIVKVKKCQPNNMNHIFEDESKTSNDVAKDVNNKASVLSEIRTITCYSMPAGRYTRSKSADVKLSAAELYDPYNIDFEEMTEKAEHFGNKTNTPEEISNNACSTSKKCLKVLEIKETDTVLQANSSEMVIIHSTRNSKDTNEEICDSDDSSKSDIPLQKYVEEKEKRAEMERNNIEMFEKSVLKDNEFSNDPVCIESDCSKIPPEASTGDSACVREETDEHLRSEQFMESFGFFSERKPRKSNLLASKKISETFHIIANESDEVYFGLKDRIPKKSSQSEAKKCNESSSESKSIENQTDKKPLKRGRKKKSTAQPVPCYCLVCKKEFRRPDNFLRHQMSLLHISKLSEVEMKIKTAPIHEEPNYLIAYKQQLDRLKILTDKLAKQKKKSKSGPKIVLPTLEEILADVNKTVREQQLSQRGLSRDEALFIDCCELLKESHKNEKPPAEGTSMQNVNNVINIDIDQPSSSGVNLIANITDEKCDSKSDGDVDSITAKNILESEEVRNLENDLISGLKEAANACSHNASNVEYEEDIEMPISRLEEHVEENSFSSPNIANSNYDNGEEFDLVEELHTRKEKKRTEVKDKLYPDVDTVDIFEDKFDKIKRKCRSQAAAAKQMQTIVEPKARHKERKKSDKKKGKKKSKKNLHNMVLTKGALKGFDGIKVSIPTSDINMASIVSSYDNSHRKKKKSNSKKKSEKRILISCGKNENDHRIKDSLITQKKVDVYEFMDNEDAEFFELRPSTLMERFKSLSNKELPSTSKAGLIPDVADNSSVSASDGDDFVYMSDDYVGSDGETENSLLSEIGAGKSSGDLKKLLSPQKRKDSIEKNAVMGKIFRNNAVRSEKKVSKDKEIDKPKANLDQLFDSLLEDEPNTSMLEDQTISPKRDKILFTSKSDRSDDLSSSDKEELILPKIYNKLSPKKYDSGNSTLSNKHDFTSSKEFEFSPPKKYECNSIKKYTGISPIKYVLDDPYGPSTSKKYTETFIDFKTNSPSTEHDFASPKYAKPSPKRCIEDIRDIAISFKGKSSKHNKCKNSSRTTNFNISLESNDQTPKLEMNEDSGVARQRARRKCTVGKQNILAETWSSESEPDGGPARPNSAESVVMPSGRKRKGKKRDGQCSGRRVSRHESRVHSSNRGTWSTGDSAEGGGREDKEQAGGSGGKVLPCVTPPAAVAGPSGLKGRPRPATYYNWSSEGDEEQEHLQQHGWIVGDSHKKLVTMLAHAKGRKRNHDDKRYFVE